MMSQQTARRVRRASGKKTALWRGMAVAIGFTVLAVVLFAVLIGLADVPDGIIRVVNQLIKVAAVFLGVRAIVPRGDENGIRRGAVLGLLYMGVGVLVYALGTGQKLTALGYAIDLLMGLAAGGLSGMLLGSMRKA